MTLEAPNPPAKPLFSPLAIAAHTVFFTPAVGGLMLARNWKRLGEVRRARIAAASGIGATAAMFALAALWRPSWPGPLAGGICFVAAVALGARFALELEKPYEAHLARGGQTAAFWPATLAAVVLGSLAFGSLLASFLLSPAHVAFTQGELALQRQDNAAAEKAFREVLRREPNDEAAHYNLALALARQGKPEEASEHLARIGADSPFAEEARRLQREIDALPPPR